MRHACRETARRASEPKWIVDWSRVWMLLSWAILVLWCILFRSGHNEMDMVLLQRRQNSKLHEERDSFHSSEEGGKNGVYKKFECLSVMNGDFTFLGGRDDRNGKAAVIGQPEIVDRGTWALLESAPDSKFDHRDRSWARRPSSPCVLQRERALLP